VLQKLVFVGVSEGMKNGILGCKVRVKNRGFPEYMKNFTQKCEF